MMKKCLGEVILEEQREEQTGRGIKGASLLQNRARQYACLAEPCAWSPQSVLSSLKAFVTLSLCNLPLRPMCVGAAWTDCQLLGGLARADWVPELDC